MKYIGKLLAEPECVKCSGKRYFLCSLAVSRIFGGLTRKSDHGSSSCLLSTISEHSAALFIPLEAASLHLSSAISIVAAIF